MARSIDTNFQSSIDADSLRPAYFLKAEFDSGDVNFWTGVGEIVFDGDTYVGSGDLLSFDEVQETQNLQANGITITLSGIPSSLVSIALSEDFQWRPLTIFFMVMNEDFSIFSSYKIFAGKMDVMEIVDDGETSSIVVSVENNLIGLRDSKERRYTPEDQKAFSPGDLGLDFVPEILDIEIVWKDKE